MMSNTQWDRWVTSSTEEAEYEQPCPMDDFGVFHHTRQRWETRANMPPKSRSGHRKAATGCEITQTQWCLFNLRRIRTDFLSQGSATCQLGTADERGQADLLVQTPQKTFITIGKGWIRKRKYRLSLYQQQYNRCLCSALIGLMVLIQKSSFSY